MELAVITFWQVIILFLLVFTGALCVRTKVLGEEAKPVLSNLLVYAVLPGMILNPFLEGYDPEAGRNIPLAFALSTAAIILGLVLTPLLFRDKNDPQRPISELACVFSNAGYMGFPLIHALFGGEGVIYASVYVTMFNVLLWTVGVWMLSREHTVREALRNILRMPVLYATFLGFLIYELSLPVPYVIRAALGYLGGMNAPVSMMITGMLIAGSNAHRLLGDRRLWRTVGVRLLLIPAACILLFLALGLRGRVAQVVLLLEACPCAAITSVLAVQYHYEEDLAGGVVVVSTLLSVVTLPLCALLVTL